MSPVRIIAEHIVGAHRAANGQGSDLDLVRLRRVRLAQLGLGRLGLFGGGGRLRPGLGEFGLGLFELSLQFAHAALEGGGFGGGEGRLRGADERGEAERQQGA